MVFPLLRSDDKQLLDAMSGLWCVNVGYGRKNLADVAYKQMQELPYYNSFKTATPPSIELAKELAEISPHDLNHAFFSSSGSEANDTVVRMVRRYWDLKGSQIKKHLLARICLSRKYDDWNEFGRYDSDACSRGYDAWF